MPLHFTKMHGLGNDYVYVSLFDQRVDDAPALARQVSDRHRGIGSDGLILVAPPEDPTAHVRMIMYNADGSRSEMCGNGIRCVAKLAYERGWAPQNPLHVQTDRGVLVLDLTIDAAGRVQLVRVDMGEPILRPADIPVRLPAIAGEQVVAAPFEIAGERVPGQTSLPVRLPLTCVSMGNPHAVFFVPDVAALPLKTWGPQIEHHPLFPQRINAHFVEVLAADRVRMITWERGTGPTQACGTGASAVCVAGVLNRLTQRKITAELPGGELQLEWDAQTNHVFKTGPAVEVFTGEWPA
jgi:diaminopimelate epimerase